MDREIGRLGYELCDWAMKNEVGETMNRASRNRWIEIIFRWIEIIFWGMVAGFIQILWPPTMSYIFRILFSRSEDEKSWLTAILPSPLSCYLLIFVLLLLLSVFVIYVIGFRLRHLITLSYPSFVICVVVGVIFYAVFQLLADSAHWWVGLIVCALFTCLRVVGIVWEKLHPNTDGNLDSPCTKRSETGNKEQPDAVKDDASWQWLDEEKPISSREQDRFGIFQKAELIAKRFGNQPEACIGIVGPFGAGKTSLINLVRNELDPRFLVVPVSCWGFENASKAEEHILSQIIIGLNEKVDCLGIRHLPQHYLRSVMSGLSWFGAALHTFLSPKSPRDRLKQLSPILRASNIHLILALEDIDRTDRNFSRAQIPALMRWLGEAHHVSLILSANEFTPFTERDRKETSPFDMHRLCEYLFDIGMPNHDLWWDILDKFHNDCLKISEGDLPSRLTPDRDDAWSYGLRIPFGPNTWIKEMFSMIKSNRQFKTLLRKTLTGWEALHGEVSFDELLLINAFRVTNPCMLNFMSELREYLNSAGCWGDSIKDKKKANEEGKQKIEMLFHQHVGNNHLQADRLKGLVGLLIPKTDRESIGIDSRPILLKWKEERYQSITSTRYTDYWNRILNEDIPEGELRDQEVWKLIDKWKQNPDTCLGLPQKIADDKEWAKKFEQFQSVLEDNDIFLRLASQHMKALRQTYGNKANADSPGFNEIWNVSRERNIKGEKKCDWIKKEIDKSICVSIELVNNLMELWGPEKKPDPSPGDNKGTILPEKRKELLKHVIEIMKHNYTGRDSGDRLAKALFSDSSKIPNTLNYLMRWHDEDKKYEREGLSGPEAWRFMADAVLAATEEHPDVMLPQVVILVGKTKSPGSDTYQFDETVIAKMFNDKKKDLMSLLAKQTDLPTGLDDQTKNDILMARELAQESEGTAAVKMPQSIKTKNPVNPV